MNNGPGSTQKAHVDHFSNAVIPHRGIVDLTPFEILSDYFYGKKWKQRVLCIQFTSYQEKNLDEVKTATARVSGVT
jgi:hypothetical protein